MSSYDPRQILIVLEDLLKALQIWSTYARDTLQEADYTQRLSVEHVERASNDVAITRSQLEKDEQLLETRKARYDAVASQCAEAVTASQETLSQAQQAAQKARQSNDKWQRELSKAQAWLERALKRLKVAQREYEKAKSALRRAERQYDHAKRQLRRCRNDDDRYSCASEERNLKRAGLNLQHAQMQLIAAQRELEAAKREVQRAQARVECCKRAVALSKQAVAKATVTLEVAEQAERAATISAEYSDIVQRLAAQAKKAFSKEATVVESAFRTVREATTFTEEAQRHLSTASSLEDSAQGYVSDIGLELDRRMDSLIALNRPLPELEMAAPAVDSEEARQPSFADNLVQLFDRAQNKNTLSSSERRHLEGTLAALLSVLPTSKFLSSIVGKLNRKVGATGEQVSATVLENTMDLRIIEVTDGRGVDIKAEDGTGNLVAVEVKTTIQSKRFAQLLGKGYGYRQCSDGWLKAVGVDPQQATVLGIQVSPESESFSIYQRLDANARDWEPILSDIAIAEFAEPKN